MPNKKPVKTSLLIYHSLICSSIIYCNTIWGDARQEALHPLGIMQKRPVRANEGLRKRDHTNDTFLK